MISKMTFRVLLCSILAVSAFAQAPVKQPAEDGGAEQAFQSQDWPQVVDAYTQITKESPTDGGAWYRLGRAQEELGRFNEALAAFQKAAALSFQPGLTKVRIAACFAALSEPDKALTMLDQLASSGFPLKQVIDDEPRFAALQLDPRYKTIIDRIEINGAPCKNTKVPEYRQLDFWVGQWDVFDAHGNQVAADNVDLILKGCVISENWTDALGAEGKSYSRYNAPMKQWEQYWVDEGPTRMFFTGHFEHGEMRFQTEGFTNAGEPVKRRLTFSELSDGSVRQLAEISKDSGANFKVEYDLTYKKRKTSSSASPGSE
jgi:tetratricopeptide (TPR) repeat protein